MQQQQAKNDLEGKETLWYIKQKAMNSRKNPEEFFKLFKQIQSQQDYYQLSLNYDEFQKMVKFCHNQATQNCIGYIFTLADFEKKGNITYQNFVQVMQIIDVEKDKPEAIKQQIKQQEIYRSMIKKLAIIKEQHQMKKIDMSKMIQLPMQCKYGQFFKYMEQNWALNLTEEEKVEITRILDKKGLYIIEPEKFLKFMGINFILPKPKVQGGGGFKPSGISPQMQKQLEQETRYKQQLQRQRPQNTSKSYNQVIGTQNINFTQYKIVNMEEYQNKANQVFKSNNQFEDSEFPADNNSLKIESGKQFRWLKPAQFFHDEYALFQKMDDAIIQSRIGLQGEWGQYITPYDVIQGELGDCYFLSSLSSLAVLPERILNLFQLTQINQQGFYAVKICYEGEWRIVWVDDSFPCRNKVEEPAFTKGNGNELWVLILEKAWAKLWGNYGLIESGLCREALRDLTGAPTEIVRCFVKDQQTKQEKKNVELPNIIEQALHPDNQFILAAGSKSEEKGLRESIQNQMGLVAGHAYSIIKIIHIKNHPQRGDISLLKMRNPWAKQEWKGNWSRQSPLWNEEIKKQHNIHLQDDGIFYMEIEDFYKYFTDVELCYYHSGYEYNSQRFKSQRRNAIYTLLRVEKAGTYYITANQKSKRSYRQYKNFEYSNTRITLFQLGDHQQFLCSNQLEDRETYIKYYLHPNETYLVSTKIKWRFSEGEEWVLSSYGPGKTSINQVQKEPFKNVLYETMMLRIQSDFRKNLKAYQNNDKIFKGYEFMIQEGLGFYYIENNSDKLFDSKISLSSLDGLKLKKPNRGNQINVILPPGEKFLAIFTVAPTGYSFSVSEQYLIKSV